MEARDEPAHASSAHAAPSADYSPLPIGPSADVYIDTPLTCGRCGYELAGLPESGACPECALPVRASLGPGAIHDAGESYQLRLVAGLKAMALAYVLTLVGIAGVFACSMVGGEEPGIAVGFAILGCLPFLGACMAWINGWWLVTTRNPVRARVGVKSRICVRVLCVLLPCIVIASVPAGFVIAELTDAAWMLPTMGFCYAYVVGLAMMGVGMRVLEGLSRAVRQGELAQTIRSTRVAAGIIAASFLLGGVLAMALPPLGATVMVLAGAGSLGLGVAWPVILFKLFRCLRDAATGRGAG